MKQQKAMGRTIFSSFVIAGAVILAGAFLAPSASLTQSGGCNSAYGIDDCAAQQATR